MKPLFSTLFFALFFIAGVIAGALLDLSTMRDLPLCVPAPMPEIEPAGIHQPVPYKGLL